MTIYVVDGDDGIGGGKGDHDNDDNNNNKNDDYVDDDNVIRVDEALQLKAC